MARRRRTKETEEEPALRLRVQKHIQALGLASSDEYVLWCVDHGFGSSVEKRAAELDEEMRTHRRELLRAKEIAGLQRNPRRLFERACAGELRAEEIARPGWREFCRSVTESKADKVSRESLRQLLLEVHDEGRFLLETVTFGDHTYRYIDALIRLNARRGQ
jgi:hypothetical protein